MHRTISRVLVVATLLLGSGHAIAHEDFRVIGTLIKSEASSIEVQSRDGRTTSIRFDRQTVITQDGNNLDSTGLTVGLSVVVDAYGDSEADLLALEIRIVPPIVDQ